MEDLLVWYAGGRCAWLGRVQVAAGCDGLGCLFSFCLLACFKKKKLCFCDVFIVLGGIVMCVCVFDFFVYLNLFAYTILIILL